MNQTHRLPLLFAGLCSLLSISSFAEAAGVENRLTMEFFYADLAEGLTRRPLENHWGDDLADGANLQAELRTRLVFSDSLSVALAPVWVTPRDGLELFLRQAYLRLVLFNTELKIGRDSLWWGPGRHGTLIVSNNAFPFDMVQVGTASPIYGFEIKIFLTQLEGNRDFPHTRLFGLRIMYTPWEALRLGATRVMMFGGKGRPGLTAFEFFGTLPFNINRADKFDVNELASVDAAFRSALFEIYGELGTEDKWSKFPLPSRKGYLVGIYFPGLIESARSDLLVEYANNHGEIPNVWYTHHLYTNGYTYRGDIIGHHMGSDSDDFFVRATREFMGRLRAGVEFDVERRGLSDPTHVIRRRSAVDLGVLYSPVLTLGASYAFERIGETSNHYFLTSLSRVF